MIRALLALTMLVAAVPAAHAQQHGHHGAPPASPYAGQERRDIKSLSADDVAELRKGGGWGLAKAAELNGVPGPAHLLELRSEIPLTPEQVNRIEAIFRDMRESAIAEGERLIEREHALEEAFRARTVTGDSLKTMIAAIEASRASLRYIRLAAHLAMPPLLTAQQLARYAELRGYGSLPCRSVPAGHDPRMWRLHTGCD